MKIMGQKTILTLAICAATVLGLSGCVDREEVKYQSSQIRGEAIDSLSEIREYKSQSGSLVIDSRPWFGHDAVPFHHGDPLPSRVIGGSALVLTFDGPQSLRQVARMIETTAGLRVNITAAPEQAGMNTEVGFIPAGGEEVAEGRIVWEGGLDRLLQQVADQFDVSWSFDGRTITITPHLTRTFMLHALAGELNIDGSISVGGGSTTSLPEQSVESEATLSIWEDIEEAIDSIIESRALASYSPATGTITVSGSPSAVNDVESYLRLQNELRLRRVVVETRVLSVTLNRSYEYNFDLDVVMSEALNNQPFVFSSLSGTGTGGNVGGRSVTSGLLRQIPAGLGTTDTVQTVVNALSAVAQEISVEHSGSVVTLSDQPAPLQVATKRSYVARVTGSAGDGSSSVSLEPGTIDIGLTMNVLPRVLDRDRVLLRVSLGLTDLVELREFSAGDSAIQLPEVDTTGFLQNVVMNSGDTLVLSGFERKSAQDADVGTGVVWNKLFGGRTEYGMGREIRVLLMTSTVLEADPVEVVGAKF